jgi:N-acetylmuramoyl-L-alanine amidase
MALIVIQRGHCYRTSGSTGTGGVDGDPTEQEWATAAAEACRVNLEALGHTVRIINADVADADYRGDGFVALHCDGSDNPTARGASVGYQTYDGQRFAQAWKTCYAEAGWTGGWRADNYTDGLAGHYGVRTAVEQGNNFAFIAEAGFLTSPADEALLWPDGPARFAAALAAAVYELWGGTPPPPLQEEDMPLIITAAGRPAALLSGAELVKYGQAQTSQGLEAAGVKVANVHPDDYDLFDRGFTGGNPPE